MSDPTPDFDHVKARMRDTWMAGDFGQIARYTEKCAADFVDRLNIRPGMRVLDVACGTGNLSIPAARVGARVTGVDIANNLLEQARQRASAESLPVEFVEGDAESLQFREGEFDVVMTMFGAMFAPRPQLVAAELARVTKPGGKIAMANWTPDGFVGKMFALGYRFLPAPAGMPLPAEWGAEATVRKRLGTYAEYIRSSTQIANFDYPFPPARVVAFFRQYFGPTQVAFARLHGQAQTEFAAELEQLWSDHNLAGDDRTFIPAEYLEVIATRL